MRASERVNRSLAGTIGAGGLGYGLLEVPEIVHQAPLAAAWWTAFAVVAIFGSCLALICLAAFAPLANLRAGLGVLAGAPVAAFLTFPLASRFAVLDSTSMWVWRIVPVGVLAAAMLFRVRGIVVYLVLVNAASSVVNCYATGDWNVVEWAQYFIRSLCLSSVFAWALGSATRTAALLDEVSDRAERSAARSAATAARVRERDRFAALIHDGVLSTLLDASRGQESPGLAWQASRTLAELDQFRLRSRDESKFDAANLIGYLRIAALRAGSRVRFAAQRSAGSQHFRIPVADADVIGAALTEAVRNSFRHSHGRAVVCEVAVTVGDDDVGVQVIDDGPGFDVGAVPPDRLGVAVSIIGRMRALPGGGATVESTPGEGTTVTLTWERRGD